MKREEQIRLARQLLESGVLSEESANAIKADFSELVESEDERIRKLLVWQVHRNIEDETNDLAQSVYDGIKGHDPDIEESIEDWKKCLAYLEKQKEQKPKMIQWTGNNLKEVIDFTGKSPRFGEWFKSWDDFENYVHSHGNILKLFAEDGSHFEVPVGSWIVKTPDGFNVPSVFRFVQKPAEWSEEDERMFNSLCTVLQGGLSAIPTEQFIYWLKSLRPQPHWKPSEEQMEALEFIITDQSCPTGLITQRIISLIDDLKKL